MNRVVPLLACVGLVLAVTRPVSSDDLRCSLRVMPGFRTEAETVLLATATADTVEAGPGGVEPSGAPGHSGSGSHGPIHGQLFEIDRFGAADSARLARAFGDRGNNYALLVPWDYDAGCEPTRWARRPAWVPPGEAGAFTVHLRPDSLWIDGLPVFDVFMADYEPYPQARAWQMGRGRRPDSAVPDLSAAEYFELLHAMPTREERGERPDSAWTRFVGWETVNPQFAGRYPADLARRMLAHDITIIKRTRALRSIEPLIAGTWRMSLSLDGEPSRSFHLRTRALPSDEWRPNTPREPRDPLEDASRPDGYSVVAAGAPTLESLPTDCAPHRQGYRGGYIYVIDPQGSADDQPGEWPGWLEPALLARQFPEDSVLWQFQLQAFREWGERWSTVGDREAPARFRRGEDGVLRVEQTIRLQDGRTLTAEGERVSDDVLACDH